MENGPVRASLQAEVKFGQSPMVVNVRSHLHSRGTHLTSFSLADLP